MVIIIDLDGVICTEERTFERALAKPQSGAGAGIRSLREQGHTVVIHTARGWAEHRMTVDWLKRQDIEYDSLLMGKPIYDLWVDDRAIRFDNWALLKANLDELKHRHEAPPRSAAAYPEDEFFLRENRRVIQEFLHWIVQQDLPQPLLEIGPMVDGRNDPDSVFHRMPEYFVDTKALFESHGVSYRSLDMDSQVGTDYVADVANLDKVIDAGSIGTLVMLSVLEHVPDVWQIPQVAYNVLKSDGLLCLQTPWNLRLHGPRPDCWRISDDGYRSLFGKLFDIMQLNKHETPERGLMPTSFTAVLRKK